MNAYFGPRSEKSSLLDRKGGHSRLEVGTLVFQPHRHFEFSGALFIKLIQSKTALVQAMQS
jgi:hypothetical protein